MDWDKFLSELENNGDTETAVFLAAMKQISEITAENLENSDKRSEINQQIELITEYKNKFGDRLYELGQMRGFRTNGENAIVGGDYYYYIADQKMKAAVYYARFLNILKTNLGRDISYIKYLMLNNMMREVRFFGASYQYLWHWKMKQAHLFRNVSGSTEPSANGLKANGIKAFFETMFNMVIDQMNKSREGTFSYSTDPFIDIFKYLKIQKNGTKSEVYESNGVKLSISDINNDSKAKFEIITNAEINSIFCGSTAYDYYSFIQNNGFDPEREYSFAVELYPTLPEEKKNDKGTTKNIKKLIYNYLKSWNRNEIDKMEYNDAAEVKHIGSWVADDKEVVTCGKIVPNDTVTVEEGRIPTTVKEKTPYFMELSKEDVIYLMLKLMGEDQNITESFDFEFENQLKARISDWIKKVKVAAANGSQPDDFSCGFCDRISIDKELKITVSSLDPKLVSNNLGTIEECVKAVSNNLIKIIKEYFKQRYEKILNSEHKVADFILDFIKKNRYTCPDYIDQYTEFSQDANDAELVLLKKILFKKGTKS